jgi:hypothetical protein
LKLATKLGASGGSPGEKTWWFAPNCSWDSSFRMF